MGALGTCFHGISVFHVAPSFHPESIDKSALNLGAALPRTGHPAMLPMEEKHPGKPLGLSP